MHLSTSYLSLFSFLASANEGQDRPKLTAPAERVPNCLSTLSRHCKSSMQLAIKAATLQAAGSIFFIYHIHERETPINAVHPANSLTCWEKMSVSAAFSTWVFDLWWARQLDFYQ